MSMDSIMEDSDYSSVSNTNAIIFNGASDFSVRTESLISGPNIPNSSSTSEDEYQQQISTAAGGGGTDDSITISSCGSSSWFKNNNDKQSDQQEIRIFNVDFRALSQVGACSTGNKGLESNNRLNSCLSPDIETRIRLVNNLMACAKAVQQKDLSLAEVHIRDIKILAISQTGAMKEVATYFAQALDLKIHGRNPQDFASVTTGYAILEALAGSNRVHVIDCSFNQGLQWMQGLAWSPGGPPVFRLTGIGPPQPDGADVLPEVGRTLAQWAKIFGLELEFAVDSLADLDASMLDIRPGDVEAIAVNSVSEPHHLLSKPGAIEKVLNLIKKIQPTIVVIVEQEANNNESVFIDRLNETWLAYTTIFENSESLTLPNNLHLQMAEQYLGREIYNLVACEGTMRVVRQKTLSQWRVKMNSAGFNPIHVGSNAYTSTATILALFPDGQGYRVEEKDGCLMLSWHTHPLIAISAWRLMRGV